MKDKNRRLKLNPFFHLSFGPPIVCDLFLDGKSIVLPNADYLRFLSLCDENETFSALVVNAAWVFEISLDEAADIVEDLIENNILVLEDKMYPAMPAVEHWLKRGWLDALILHLKSRDIFFSDTNSNNPDEHNRKVMKQFIAEMETPEFWKKPEGKDVFNLSPPEDLPNEDFQETLLKRRSNRPWKCKNFSSKQLSSILHYANLETVRLRKEAEKNWQTKPEVLLNSSFSALETYLLAFSVEGIKSGLYFYNPKQHQLVLKKRGSFENELIKICIGQDRIKGASCAFIITSVWERYMFRYRHPRAYRTLLINVAELAQKYILLATAHNLSTFLTPAILDEYAEEFLDVDGFTEAPLYVVAIG